MVANRGALLRLHGNSDMSSTVVKNAQQKHTNYKWGAQGPGGAGEQGWEP